MTAREKNLRFVVRRVFAAVWPGLCTPANLLMFSLFETVADPRDETFFEKRYFFY